jgi:hypothetical protein
VDFDDIRRTTIAAMFSDDVLAEQLVVKGGNALRLIHGIGQRASLDLDLSTEAELDEADVAARMHRSLLDRFDSAGYLVFDFAFGRRPRVLLDPRQAGYEARFKVIPKETARRIGADRARLQRESATVGPGQLRVFTVQVSAYEYCQGSQEVEFDHLLVRVYTPAMIAVEKYRAICQQDEDYRPRSRKAPRARDFFDIHSIVTMREIDLETAENHRLFALIFEAKRARWGCSAGWKRGANSIAATGPASVRAWLARLTTSPTTSISRWRDGRHSRPLGTYRRHCLT